jgi:4-diphosphocytidyl-2-C-methyl-D-erythritol kinase
VIAPLSAFAPAKINLFLHVGDKRADGYHEICSLAAFADVGDRVDGTPAAALSLALAGPFAQALAGEGEDNLVLRAARAFRRWAHDRGRRVDGARLTLHKALPVASGIGGGSSDAAATLKLLNALWYLSASDADLVPVAAMLGADVPVCLRAEATLMRGIGERLTPWPGLASLPVLLVNPQVAVKTADVFRALGERSGVEEPPHGDPNWFLSPACRNDLEAPAIRMAPVIADVLSALRASAGCRLARMSGSGATCFGVFGNREQAIAAAQGIGTRSPNWWLVPATLR